MRAALAKPETFVFKGQLIGTQLKSSGKVEVTFRAEWSEHPAVYGLTRWIDTELDIEVRAGKGEP